MRSSFRAGCSFLLLGAFATEARACSVIPYLSMLFEGHEAHRLLMQRGFLVALTAAVIFKIALLHRRMRMNSGADPAGPPVLRVALAVVSANIASVATGFFAVFSLSTTGGIQVMFNPLISFLAGCGWVAILKRANSRDLQLGPFGPSWYLFSVAAGVLLWPLTLGAFILSFMMFYLVPVICLLTMIGRRLGWLPPAAPPVALTPEEAARAGARYNPVAALCGMGFAASVIGFNLQRKVESVAAIGASSGDVTGYWLAKVTMVTLVLAVALVATTAIEAVVLLPLYRHLLSSAGKAGPADPESLESYEAAFGQLFRINALAVVAVLVPMALLTLPTRLSSPGFLF